MESELENYIQLRLLERLLNILAGLNARENKNSRDSTKISEHQEENQNNEEINKTNNIVIENKEVFSIETNIKNLSEPKENEIDKAINLDQIQVSFALNSEENKINNNENNNIINNK